MTELNSRQDYLKRYLNDPKRSKIKKKKVKSDSCYKQSRFKIVDEDIDMKKIEVAYTDEDEIDEAPLVVNVIDERPVDVKVNEMYSCERWKKVDSCAKVKSEKLEESMDQSNSSCDFSCADDVVFKTRHDSENDHSPLKSAVKLSHGAMQELPRSKHLSIVQHDSESDMSPPRVKRFDSSDNDLSPPRVKRFDSSDNDLSPPRNKVKDHHHKQDYSPPTGRVIDHHNYKQGGFSLPRNKVDNHNRERDLSCSRSKIDDHQHHHENNFSPPRCKAKDQHRKSRDFSPSRRKGDKWCHKQDSSSSKTHGVHHTQRDISPRRRKEKTSKHVSDSSKKTSSQVQDTSDSDFSPPRKRSSVELSKIQPQHSGSCKPSQYSSPPEKHSKRPKKRHDSNSDNSSHSEEEHNSTKRKNVIYSDSQLLVPKGRPYRMEMESLHKPHTSGDPGTQKKRPSSTLSGMKAGLQNSASLHDEIHNFKLREKMALEDMDDELSGRNAETVSRDKDTGRRRNIREERLKQKEKDKKNSEKLEKYLEWGKGLKQKDDQQKRIQEDLYEMSKPLARYANDDDLEKQLKDVLKDEDPMLEYMKRKRQKNQPVVTSSFPIYEGPPAPPNRFNISPGFRWDGVDRSNGFEKRFFEKINNTKATECQAYLWSIENM